MTAATFIQITPEADTERLAWLTRMTFMHRSGPMDQAAWDRAAADAEGIIAGGTCPDPGNHRLRALYLNERCLACGAAPGLEQAAEREGAAVVAARDGGINVTT